MYARSPSLPTNLHGVGVVGPFPPSQQVTIEMLPEDILLDIFRHYLMPTRIPGICLGGCAKDGDRWYLHHLLSWPKSSNPLHVRNACFGVSRLLAGPPNHPTVWRRF